MLVHLIYNSLHVLTPNSPSIPPSTWQPQVCSLCPVNLETVHFILFFLIKHDIIFKTRMTANHYAVLMKARHSSKGFFFFLIGGKLLYNITLVSAVHFNEVFWHSLVKISWLVALIHFFCSGEVIELVWQQASLSS